MIREGGERLRVWVRWIRGAFKKGFIVLYHTLLDFEKVNMGGFRGKVNGVGSTTNVVQV